MTSIFSDIGIPQQTQTQAVPQQQTNSQPIAVKDAIPASTVKEDTVEISNKKEKKGIIKSTKGFIAGVKKFFASAGEYTKGTIKGLTSGAVAGSVVYTSGAIVNGVRNSMAAKAGKTVKNIPNKIIAAAVALGTLAANIWTASLNATEKQSEIDMRWTGVEPKK